MLLLLLLLLCCWRYLLLPQDKRFTFDEWRSNADLKAQLPFGQLPVLEVDGKYLAQSSAIGE